MNINRLSTKGKNHGKTTLLSMKCTILLSYLKSDTYKIFFNTRKKLTNLINNYKRTNMHKAVQAILLIVGVILIGYGIYTMITPEASVDLGIVEAEIQDNNNAYITIGLGVASLVLGLLSSKKG